jgi:hypothetical protein
MKERPQEAYARLPNDSIDSNDAVANGLRKRRKKRAAKSRSPNIKAADQKARNVRSYN